MSSLSELLDRFGANLQSELFTGVVAEVISYDPNANTIDARIVVRNAVFDLDGGRTFEPAWVIPSVPVQWPQGGGKIIRFPIETGDSVWLSFSHASLAEWRVTGQVSAPTDARRHSIGYPVAIPGVRPDTKPLSPLDAAQVAAGAMVLGENGGAQIRIGGALPGVKVAPAGIEPIMPVALAPPLLGYVAAAAAAATAGAASDIGIKAALTAINAALVAIAAIPVNSAAGSAVGAATAAINAAKLLNEASNTAAGAAATSATQAAGAIPSTILKSM